MNWKKLGRALLFPPLPLLLALLPVCGVGLTVSMLRLEETDPVRIAFYVLSFYTLAVWCVRVPALLGSFRRLREENRHLRRWRSDVRLRTHLTLLGNLIWNGGYALLQLGLSVYHRSAWFCSLALYYGSLAGMRWFLAGYTRQYQPGERLREEWRRCRICGWSLLVLNLALTVMIFYMVVRNRTVRHHEITTIAMAAFTFASLTMAIVNLIRYRKYHSPALSAARAISLASACVSMLTLEGTMLATFRSSDLPLRTRQLFLGITGTAISLFILATALYLIVRGSRQIRRMEHEYEA